MTRTRLYNEWSHIKNRCGNPRHHQYADYGGRGITVCEEWKNSFEAFRDWALANGYRDDLTIERKDTNGDYCPENCKWATRKEQQNNKRNNRVISCNGKTQTLAQWSEETGIGESTIRWRLAHGYAIERALTEKVKKGGEMR